MRKWIGLAALGIGAWFLLRSGEPTLTLDARARVGLTGSFAELPSGITHFERSGPEGAPLVVLISGFTTPYFIWDAVVRELNTRGFATLRYEPYGRGYSDRPETRYDESLFERQLGELLEHLRIREPVALFGVSMGGAIAAIYADRHPERVSRLVLSAPGGFPLPPALSLVQRLAAAPGVGFLFERALGGWFVRLALPRLVAVPSLVPALEASVAASMRFDGFLRALRATARDLPLESLEPVFARLGAHPRPTLVIWGTEDRIIPFEVSGKVRAALPRAEFVEIPGLGHLPFFEAPTLVLPKLLAWLRAPSEGK